jgi:large subunit ribosomal protein L29
MKVTERVNKMRDMSVDELTAHEGSMREQLFQLRFQWAMGQTETLSKIRQLRKDRARVRTILREKAKG